MPEVGPRSTRLDTITGARSAHAHQRVPVPHPRRRHRPRPVGQRPLVRGPVRRQAGPGRGHRPRDFHHTVYLLGTTPFGLHQHKTPAGEGEFSEFRVGLDHVAFGVANRAELEKWARRLDELGIVHGGIKDASYGSGLSFRDPDGIALEFFAPPA
jgi:catechol 2,3-dioxygenase-like lactoylglutathione lyase family enzyme